MESIHTHISRQFNAELEEIRSRVLEMGGLVEQQIDQAIHALVKGDVALAEELVKNDYKVNKLEVTIDEECNQIIARRQPTAGDLRLVVAVIKTITDLERIGDEAEKVGKMVVHLTDEGITMDDAMNVGIDNLGSHVRQQLQRALDAFARLDTDTALEVALQDARIDREYDGLLRQIVTYMMADPRAIATAIDYIWAARAFERIGDHTKNLCEYIVYLVKGKDVRHTSYENIPR
jgi:phosphate transport system protein